MSVSVPSPTAEHALSIFRAHGGVLKTKSAMELGIHPRTLYALRDADRLERLDRGTYRSNLVGLLEERRVAKP